MASKRCAARGRDDLPVQQSTKFELIINLLMCKEV